MKNAVCIKVKKNQKESKRIEKSVDKRKTVWYNELAKVGRAGANIINYLWRS